MGMKNIDLAFAHWPDLPGRAFQVLVWMAKVARDADDPPECYQGREKLCVSFGRRVPDEPAEDDPEAKSITAERDAAFKLLADHVATLKRWGALLEVQRARPGRGARYALNLSPERVTKFKKVPEKRGRLDPKNVHRSDPPGPENRASVNPKTVPSATRKRSTEVPENRGAEEEGITNEEENEETSQLAQPHSVAGAETAREAIRRARSEAS